MHGPVIHHHCNIEGRAWLGVAKFLHIIIILFSSTWRTGQTEHVFPCAPFCLRWQTVYGDEDSLVASNTQEVHKVMFLGKWKSIPPVITVQDRSWCCQVSFYRSCVPLVQFLFYFLFYLIFFIFYFLFYFFYGNKFVHSTGVHTVANIVLITMTP